MVMIGGVDGRMYFGAPHPGRLRLLSLSIITTNNTLLADVVQEVGLGGDSYRLAVNIELDRLRDRRCLR